MSDFDFDIGDTATSFNDATQFGLDDTAAAAEAGITIDNSYDFAQGPDGNLGSSIPGAGGDLNNNGWYTVDYNQPAVGVDTQPAIADGAGPIDVNADGSDFAALGNDQVAALNPVPAAVSDKFLNDLSVSQNSLTNILPASLTTTVNDLTASLRSAFAAITNKVSANGATPVSTSGFQGQTDEFGGIPNAAPDAVSNTTGFQGQTDEFGGIPNAAPSPLDTFQADLTKARATFAAAGIPLPSVFSANPVTAILAALNNKNGTTAGSTTAAALAASLLPTALSPTAVGSSTASASVLDAAVNAALNATVAGLSADQVLAAASTAAAAEAYTLKLSAQRAQVLAAQTKQSNNGDWRVRLSLAPGADYLYNATPNGILAPLKNTGGVIFPYTPKISTSYSAMYSQTDLTHSNYKGYFYQNSNVGEISIEAKFTAQDTNEAQYLLAVIHFFRSITRMFYGQDAQRGAPPPLVFLTGFGEYQFNQHPCVVTNFSYNMPDNVDYIRARSVNINGASLLTRRDRQTSPTDPISGAIQRISNLFSSQGISPGAIVNRPAPPTLGQNNPTYVPTSVDLSLRLLPIQSRAQVSQQFSLKEFANGRLITKGFW